MIWTIFIDLTRNSFDVDDDDCAPGKLDIVSATVDTVFVADLLLNMFIFGYENNYGQPVLEHRECFLKYAKKRLWFDLITSFPVFWVIFALGDICTNGQISSVQYTRFLRLVTSFSATPQKKFKQTARNHELPFLFLLFGMSLPYAHPLAAASGACRSSLPPLCAPAVTQTDAAGLPVT